MFVCSLNHSNSLSRRYFHSQHRIVESVMVLYFDLDQKITFLKSFAYSFIISLTLGFIFGFFAAFGFFACLAMVLFAKFLGVFLKRPDSYYDDAIDDDAGEA